MSQSRRVEKRPGAFARRAAPAIAVVCAALAAPLAAQAQRFPGDTSRCRDLQSSQSLSLAMKEVTEAQDLAEERSARVTAVLTMDSARLRSRFVTTTGQIDRLQEELSRTPSGYSQERLKDLIAQRDLLYEAMESLEIGARIDPQSNPYTRQVQDAQEYFRSAHDRYVWALAACGQTNDNSQQVTENYRPQADTDARILTPPPTVATPPAPPPPSTGRSAGGRIKFKPMSEEDTRRMTGIAAPNGPPTGGAVDLSSWRGAYHDGQQVRYDLTATGAHMAVVASVPPGSMRFTWDGCQAQGAGVVCDMWGEMRAPDGHVEIAGSVVASRSGGVVSGAYTVNGVTTRSGPPAPIRAGEVIPFTYQPF